MNITTMAIVHILAGIKNKNRIFVVILHSHPSHKQYALFVDLSNDAIYLWQ